VDRGVKLSSGLKLLTWPSGAGAAFAGAFAMGDRSVVRELVPLLALVLIGCGGTPHVLQI